ncbi:MAG TPA: AAA family ATPase [Gaiellaceae bacterium]|nr:AAA family ATPase [Gaiellaceae bacterium]
MAKILVTGMSGSGKSSVLRVLGERGHRVVDTDTDEWRVWVDDGWNWREDAIDALLAGHEHGHLFLAGCHTNQGRFYDRLDGVVLLSAPPDVLLVRIDARDDNPYGKSAAERELVLQHLEQVEPLLRATATAELDASAPLAEVADRLEAIAEAA